MTANRESVYRTVTRTGCAVAFSAVLAVGLGAPSAHAQTSHDYDRNTTESEYVTRIAAYNGYSDGFEKGARDLRIGPDFKPQLDENFLRASTGYAPEMGAFASYQSAFRMAYTRGYSDAHSGRGRDSAMNVPPSPSESSYGNAAYRGETGEPGGRSLGVATARGYDAGYTQGVEDNRRGSSYGYREEDVYRAATDGYYPSLGDEGRYQVVFRQIYARGYSDGFNGRERYTEAAVQGSGRDEQHVETPPIVSQGDAMQIATVSGYHDGFEHGTTDRQAHETFGYRHDEAYQQATAGYDPSWNMERDYQNTFRQGYVAGYKAAYYGHARNQSYEDRYNQNSGYGSNDDRRGAYGDASRNHGTPDSSASMSQAAERGYRNGHERGQYDRRIGTRKPNPRAHGAFQFALDGWEPKFGDRAAYQREFRASFERGYDDGFEGRESPSVARPR